MSSCTYRFISGYVDRVTKISTLTHRVTCTRCGEARVIIDDTCGFCFRSFPTATPSLDGSLWRCSFLPSSFFSFFYMTLTYSVYTTRTGISFISRFVCRAIIRGLAVYLILRARMFAEKQERYVFFLVRRFHRLRPSIYRTLVVIIRFLEYQRGII